MVTTARVSTEELYPPRSPVSPSASLVRDGRFDHEQDGPSRPLLADENGNESEAAKGPAPGEDQ